MDYYDLFNPVDFVSGWSYWLSGLNVLISLWFLICVVLDGVVSIINNFFKRGGDL